jgi:hypothetical protein
MWLSFVPPSHLYFVLAEQRVRRTLTAYQLDESV